jgi:hypothetical protein
LFVVRFAGKVRHDLVGKTNADAQDFRWERGEEAVVKSASAPEAVAVGGEGKSGDEDDFRGGGVGDRALFGIGFENAESARF